MYEGSTPPTLLPPGIKHQRGGRRKEEGGRRKEKGKSCLGQLVYFFHKFTKHMSQVNRKRQLGPSYSQYQYQRIPNEYYPSSGPGMGVGLQQIHSGGVFIGVPNVGVPSKMPKRYIHLHIPLLTVLNIH